MLKVSYQLKIECLNSNIFYVSLKVSIKQMTTVYRKGSKHTSTVHQITNEENKKGIKEERN